MKNLDGISFLRYLPSDDSRNLTGQLVECYRDVFSTGPWHEWLKCEKCEEYWGIRDQELLTSWSFRHCGVPLSEFWPRETVLADLKHEITPGSSSWLALAEGKVIGFSWGYPISFQELEKKLDLPLANAMTERFGERSLIAYQDEVGVVSSYRGRKIAKAMVRRRLEDFLAQDLEIGIVRTRQYPEPSETFSWYERIGYETLARYPDGRVILGRRLDNVLSALLED